MVAVVLLIMCLDFYKIIIVIIATIHLNMMNFWKLIKNIFFINQKKNMIETYKKNTKEHLKSLEDFELPFLTSILNKLFSNVDQLTYVCDICNNYTAKNKALLLIKINVRKNVLKKIILFCLNKTFLYI